MSRYLDINAASTLAWNEALRCANNRRPFASSHEAFAVLKEEVDELWEDVKSNNLEGARKEAIQVAAMALRFIAEIPTRKDNEE